MPLNICRTAHSVGYQGLVTDCTAFPDEPDWELIENNAWVFSVSQHLAMIRGKVCAVFGGSRGIGKAVCEILANHGGSVAVLGRDASKAAETASRLSTENCPSSRHKSFSCDVSDQTSVLSSVAEVQSTLGQIDILVNSAGINKDSLLLRTKGIDIEKLTSTNLFGSIYTCQAVLRQMLQQRKGCIINVGSIVGLNGNVGQAVYSASKAGKALDKQIFQVSKLYHQIYVGSFQ